ncbi:MAG TPA: chromosome segregation protein SMC [Dehalococcoidia bacterium]|nr:chromosome segregation protein SMC [Dehalococcoidia bacterium]
MYLKKLEIQGFKSFANKTALHFGTGVTCVVGPNGTGKTNVADSLRWVLGEHASRMLRARKTEDVIFAGSDKRAPMGVAEVNITLDNSGHWLPIAFDEVVVSRRAYRSGENEYLINNTKVRLRDVVDLFMRAQVGQNSYAFMGQGMVEQVLSLRPEDRRGLIEEAAEVRLYRTQLEDAQHKLTATRENMDRVRMLVREIEPRINQLERQAGRALKYQDLARELAETLHVWYGHQWREINDLVLAAVTTLDQRAEELERARNDARACDDGLAQLRAAIAERRAEIAARDERLRKLQDYIRDLERRAALDGERARMLTERLDELADELATLRADEAAQARTMVAPDTAHLELAVSAARDELAQLRARLASVEQEILRLQQGAMADEQAAATALAAVEDLTHRITDAADAAAGLRREHDASLAERKKLIGELAAWAAGYARVARDAATAAPRLEQAIREREREAAAAAAYRRDQPALEAELRTLRAEMDAASVRLELIESIDAAPPHPDAGVRMILEAGGLLKRETVPAETELRGVVGLVGQLLRVPPGLEKAIEAALAENLFAIVMEREADLRTATALLLEGDAGRATMYALDNFQDTRPLHLIKERGMVGVASGLVRCDSRYRRLVDTLLGRTVVVEDASFAQRVVRRGLAAAVATLDGVLVRPVGSVAAGSQAAVRATFVRERELADLPAALERLRPLVEEKEAALRDALRQQQDAERRAADLLEEIDRRRAEKAQVEMALATARPRLEAIAARLRSHTSAARQRDARAASLRELRDRAEGERAARADEARTRASLAEQARGTLVALEAERAELIDAVAEHAAQVARLEGELRSGRQVTDAERAAHERVTRQIATKEAQHSAMTQEAQAITARLSATRRELDEQSGDAQALQAELEPARQELAQFESRERELSAQLAESNERMRGAERLVYEAEGEVRTRRDELEQLRQTLDAEGFVATADGEVHRAPEPEPEPGPGEQAPAAYAHAPGDLPPWLRTEDGPDLPPVRGGAAVNPTEMRDRVADLRAQIRALGPVNEEAASEYEESRERFDFLSGQLGDMTQAEEQLLGAIAELETEIRERFRGTFKLVNREFERYFSAFFRGGTARLELGDPDEYGLPGVEIYAQPPGKKLGSLALLSGGERSLTAVALLFALLQANPSPICVLDEVDAALDEANVGRFVEELRALSQRTQFIIITHNRRTIETADTIYGVSMGADSVSRVLSLRLADVADMID